MLYQVIHLTLQIIIIKVMRKREIKKTIISYQQETPQNDREMERSREKKVKIEIVDINSRKARLEMIRNRQQQEQTMNDQQLLQPNQPNINLTSDLLKIQKIQENIEAQKNKVKQTNKSSQKQQKSRQFKSESIQNQQQSFNSSQNDQQKIMLKPVYISKQDRTQEHINANEKQQQRKKKAMKYTKKLLLLENAKDNQGSDEQLVQSSDEELQTKMPDDDDNKSQEYEYELWKVRQLKRIRRDREERRKLQKEKAELERRRKLNNEEILLQNKVMGSDATDNTQETKYVYLQKYYHKGAFYQDSDDAIFKRDYNLPTPLQMQDKSMLPQILQKRQGNFGKKGQSKYTHLTAQDTTNFDPQYRPDQSILASWKKKMAGYKGSGRSNI